MLQVGKLSKLTVGDVAAYERWRRDERKKKLRQITKDLHGDNIPPDALEQIERQLKMIPKLEDNEGFDVTAAQYLFWRSLSKKDPDITLEQVGEMLDANDEKLAMLSELLFPQPDTVKNAKKPIKKKVKRKKKNRDN